MKTLHLSFEEKDFEYLKSKKESSENWQSYLLRLVKEKEENNGNR